jgi:catechol 1,2-dioxygenase/hydroxyquinol 1,2-dioxygenase
MDFSVETATQVVVDSLRDAPDERLRTVLEQVVRHLHDLVRETGLTQQEWAQAVRFLTAVGQQCDDTRQEVILLSDVLGLSMLVEALHEPAGATESTVLGPFHQTASPPREPGDDISPPGAGPACLVTGHVLSTLGGPVAGAVVDVWQSDAEGFYDVQRQGQQPAGTGRGLFRTDDEGAFRFRTVVPSPYPIPTDGPVGDLLRATRRHCYRPAHLHLLVSAPGYHRVTTHAFVEGSPYIDSDAVFAVRRSLVVPFREVDDPEAARRHGLPSPFRHADVEVVLAPEAPEPAPLTEGTRRAAPP